jgi:hypothetical protein
MFTPSFTHQGRRFFKQALPKNTPGLTQPYLVKNPVETEYIDYNCFEKGVDWKLFGDYRDRFFNTRLRPKKIWIIFLPL